MNLFILDLDFELNAQYHVDDHVNKIALEACQVLSTALWLRQEPGVSYDAAVWYQKGLWATDARASMPRAYTPTHIGSIAHWLTDPVNYMWCLRYTIELCKEHQFRKGAIVQQWRMASQLPRFTVSRSPSIWYAAVDESHLTADKIRAGKKVSTDRVVEVYRQYYRHQKSHLHPWTGRRVPEWLQS